MFKRILLTAAVGLTAAACASAVPTPGTASSADGTYKGTQMLTKNLSTGCPGNNGSTSLTVMNGMVRWPVNPVLMVDTPLRPDGTFAEVFGTTRLDGKINGSHIDAYQESMSCHLTYSLNKVP